MGWRIVKKTQFVDKVKEEDTLFALLQIKNGRENYS